MQPNQNPYDFLNTPAPKKGFGATTQKGRIMQVIIGLAILLVVFVVIFSFVFSGNSGPKTALLEVKAAQADIIALTTDGNINLRDSKLKSQAIMINYTTVSQANDTAKILAAYGIGKSADKQAKAYQDTKYVNQLKTALTNNSYDVTYQKVLADKLGVYRAKLRNTYSAISSTSKKTQLSDFYNQVELLAPSPTQ